MEVLLKLPQERPRLKAALFDFDGTISTLREGWECVMEPLMVEEITGNGPVQEELAHEVRDYIRQSTGIQTIHQMKWLVEAVERYGRNKNMHNDPWEYKKEYNRRLMRFVEKRKNSVASGDKRPQDFMIGGSEKFLNLLKDKGIEMYLASGTDHPDVIEEANVLGVGGYFSIIAGAPLGIEDCSKEAVLRRLIQDKGLRGQEVIVIGDGKVEIALGREAGAITLGVASDEIRLCGVNHIKRERLVKAGAHAITGDFIDAEEILEWLGL